MVIYITRHGESLNNTLNIIGGDSLLTDKGREYGIFLSDFFKNMDIDIATSDLKRTKQTVQHIQYKEFNIYKELNEISSGDFDNMNIEYIKNTYNEIYKKRNNNKLEISYPNGECYLDLEKRVVKCIKNILLKYIDSENILIVAHQAVCRILFSYFYNIQIRDCVNMKIKLHTLYKV